MSVIFYPDLPSDQLKQPIFISTIERNTFSQKLSEFFNSATCVWSLNLLARPLRRFYELLEIS